MHETVVDSIPDHTNVFANIETVKHTFSAARSNTTLRPSFVWYQSRFSLVQKRIVKNLFKRWIVTRSIDESVRNVFEEMASPSPVPYRKVVILVNSKIVQKVKIVTTFWRSTYNHSVLGRLGPFGCKIQNPYRQPGGSPERRLNVTAPLCLYRYEIEPGVLIREYSSNTLIRERLWRPV